MTIRIRLTRLPHGEGLPLPSYTNQKNSLFQKIMFTNCTLNNCISISCRRSVLELLLDGYIVLAWATLL